MGGPALDAYYCLLFVPVRRRGNSTPDFVWLSSCVTRPAHRDLLQYSRQSISVELFGEQRNVSNNEFLCPRRVVADVSLIQSRLKLQHTYAQYLNPSLWPTNHGSIGVVSMDSWSVKREISRPDTEQRRTQQTPRLLEADRCYYHNR